MYVGQVVKAIQQDVQLSFAKKKYYLKQPSGLSGGKWLASYHDLKAS